MENKFIEILKHLNPIDALDELDPSITYRLDGKVIGYSEKFKLMLEMPARIFILFGKGFGALIAVLFSVVYYTLLLLVFVYPKRIIEIIKFTKGKRDE